MELKFTTPIYPKEYARAEEFIAMMCCFDLPCHAVDEDCYEFRVKDLTYHLGTGRVTRDGYAPEPERGINALLALLGHSSDELPPSEIFNPEHWPGGTFGPPSLG